MVNSSFSWIAFSHRFSSTSSRSSTPAAKLTQSTPLLIRSTLPVRPSTSGSKSTRTPTSQVTGTGPLAAAALLSRAPLLLRPLTEFESSYYEYQRQLSQSLSKPLRSSFFFRPGSHAARAYELSAAGESLSSLPHQRDAQDGLPQGSTGKPDDLTSLERAPDRSVYLLIKPTQSSPHWQLPLAQIEKSETLIRAALRAVHDQLGPNMDIWSIGRVPATVYNPPESEFQSVWIMPQRILRGRPSLMNSQTPTRPQQEQDSREVDDRGQFGWLTAEEIRERVEERLWSALEPVLKH